jgi:hypothetical protein
MMPARLSTSVLVKLYQRGQSGWHHLNDKGITDGSLNTETKMKSMDNWVKALLISAMGSYFPELDLMYTHGEMSNLLLWILATHQCMVLMCQCW